MLVVCKRAQPPICCHRNQFNSGLDKIFTAFVVDIVIVAVFLRGTRAEKFMSRRVATTTRITTKQSKLAASARNILLNKENKTKEMKQNGTTKWAKSYFCMVL